MLDIKPQPSLAAAITEMMWGCAFAAARVADAFAARGAALWSQMLHPTAERPSGLIPPESAMGPSSGNASQPAGGPDCSPPALAEPAEALPAEAAFANYRSAGGHASAQVVVPPGGPAEAGQAVAGVADAGSAQAAKSG